MKKKGILIAGILLLLCIAAGIFYFTSKPKTTEDKKEFSVTVIHADKTEETFTYETTEKYLGNVLTANKLIEGTKGEYGLYITSVDGETADEAKEQWWCITKEGAQVTTAVDKTPIKNGDSFELTLKEGFDF